MLLSFVAQANRHWMILLIARQPPEKIWTPDYIGVLVQESTVNTLRWCYGVYELDYTDTIIQTKKYLSLY